MQIEKIYSRQEPSVLLHLIVDTKQVVSQRLDLTPEEQWLQVSLIPLVSRRKMRAHIHQERPLTIPVVTLTQESWFVISGSISVCLYDLDESQIFERKLKEGEMLITFRGGHSMETSEESAVVMETKNGPYFGRDFTYI